MTQAAFFDPTKPQHPAFLEENKANIIRMIIHKDDEGFMFTEKGEFAKGHLFNGQEIVKFNEDGIFVGDENDFIELGKAYAE